MISRILLPRAGALVLLLPLVICLDAAPRSAGQQAPPPAQSPAARAMGVRWKAKGIPNFGKVTPNLFRGGLPNNEGMEALQKLGVNVVVDMRGNNKDEEAEATKLGMQYVPIPSHCPFPKDETFAKFLKVMEENPGKKVFVHCRLGDDRTGMAVAAYRMANEGWSADEAMKEMKEFGFTTFHHSMCPGMSGYEKSFPQRLKTNPAFKDLQPRGAPPNSK
jgi:tyrosine-protein phosphatase SIW14